MKTPDLNEVRKTLKITDYPVQLVLEVVAACNLSCRACPYPNLKREKGVMSDDLYEKIVSEIGRNSPNETNLWFAFMGEPTTLGEKLFRMIKLAKDKGIKNTSLNTNATLITGQMIDWIFQSGIDKIYISVDAASADSYGKIRIGGDFQKVKENTLKLLAKRKEKGLKKPEVITQFISMEENSNEEESFKEYWPSVGAIAKIRRKLGWGGQIESKDLNIAQSDRNMPCPWIMRQMVVLWDGRVAQCDADYEGIYSAGDINKQTIFEVWNGELKKRREKHLGGDFDFMPCSQCNDWQVGLSEFYYPKK